MQVKRISGNRKLLIGLLLVLWSLPAVIRPLHIHHELCAAVASGEEEEHTDTHDCHSCPLCCFALAPYVEVAAVEIPSVLASAFRQWRAIATEGYVGFHFTPTLRGPPAV